MANKLKFVILKNETQDDHLLWEIACTDFQNQVSWRVVDLTRHDWLENIQKESFDILLSKPGAQSNAFKQLYDERIYILERVLGYQIFPSAEEVFIYENKRFFSFWVKANNIPHPDTNVFYNQDDALKFASSHLLPLVAKTNIGASGRGVVILKNKKQAEQYIQNTFSGKGAAQRIGPNLEKGGLFRRGLYYFLNPNKIKAKLKIYEIRSGSIQKDFV
jgi:hypothetical protein